MTDTRPDIDNSTIACDLAAVFSKVDAPTVFEKIVPYVVRGSTDNRPYFEPYVPYVGPKFPRSGGVLVYATAQNLSNGLVAEPGDPAMFRMWERVRPEKGMFVQHCCVPIQPWLDGILPALVATWHLAQHNTVLTLDEIDAITAVSNFYKFSLVKSNGKSDLNPRHLRIGGFRASDYAELTYEHYVAREIDFLKPSTIFTFKGPQATCLRQHFPSGVSNVVEVNDPAWIKRGMSKVSRRTTGSWWRRVNDNRNRLTDAEKLIDGFRFGKPYSDTKREAARLYLLYYFMEFLEL